jgi:aminodeoxyfutalosine synthase
MIAELAVSDPALAPVARKVLDGLDLSQTDGVALYSSRDIHGIGRMADLVRRRLHGTDAYYNRNRHINYTNVCALSCKFCSFYRKRGEEGAYEMPVEQVVATAQKAAAAGATEVHIVGGLHPWLKFDYYLDVLSGIRRTCPDLHIKAFTAIEIIHLSRVSRQSVPATLAALRDAGLGSLPGGGAEIFDDRVHDEVFKGKVRADSWFAGPSHGARTWDCVQRHHALRPRRNAGRARRAFHQTAATSGRISVASGAIQLRDSAELHSRRQRTGRRSPARPA